MDNLYVILRIVKEMNTMYHELRNSLRITDKIFDKNLASKLKNEIVSGEYGDISENALSFVKKELNTLLDLFSVLGLHIFNIDSDYTHWSKIEVAVKNIKILEKLLQNYSECFDVGAVVSVRNNDEFTKFDFRFTQTDKGFIESILPIIKVDNKEEFGFDGKVLFSDLEKTNTISASEAYDMINSPWSNDAITYNIQRNFGLYKAISTIIFYDSCYIEVFGYGHDKYGALKDCDRNIEILKRAAIGEGYNPYD